MEPRSLAEYCHQLLDVAAFQDYCPNGLQVQGERDLQHLVSGVTASMAMVDAAVAAGADALLVHHGFFWKGESPCLVGMKGRRIRRLMQNDISLFAYHLPLDANPEYGNNAALGRLLGWSSARPVDTDGKSLLWRAELPQAVDLNGLAAQVGDALARPPLAVSGGTHPVRTLAWCTGAAQGYIEQAAELGVDVYLSGEISEPTVHQARELGIHYIAAGHHATERYGVQALGQHLAERFGVAHTHIDIPNPV